jgi:hypothetical protein
MPGAGLTRGRVRVEDGVELAYGEVFEHQGAELAPAIGGH